MYMKNKRSCLLILSITILFLSCKKDSPLPYINTNGITEITAKTAVSGGVITAEKISDKGLCWGVDAKPDLLGNSISAGTGNERFEIKMTGLKSNTLYYARAYATNEAGTVYGEAIQFKTLMGPPPPTIITTPLTTITTNSIEIAANIQNTGQIKLLSYGVCWAERTAPTVDNNKTQTVLASYNTFTAIVSGLEKGKKYYARAYAKTDDEIFYGSECVFNTYADLIIDIDGNEYHTIKIGTQEWTVENLKTTRFRNGTAIPVIMGDYSWQQANVSAYCYYNDDISNALQYGLLYNWYAVSDSKKLAPAGWHIPSTQEYQQLIAYLGGEIAAGQKMRASDLGDWYQTTTINSNESGFTALPAGRRDGNSSQLGTLASFWTGGQSANYMLNYYNITQSYGNNNVGCSVRCVKD